MISELVDPVKILVRNLAESFTTGATLTKIASKFRALAESFTVTGTVATSKIKSRSLTESFTFGESLAMVRSKARSLTESFTVGEILTRTLVKLRSFISVESFTITGTAFAAKQKSKSLTETVTFSEALSRTLLKARFLYETDAKPHLYIPLFIYPNWWVGDPYDWTPLFDVIEASPGLQFVVAVNVASGPDVSLNTDYVQGLTDLFAAGQVNNNLTIIGYVFTSYGARVIGDVEADIDNWVSFYGTWIDGIFLDEMNNVTGSEAYYTNITAYAKVTKGLSLVFGNPGAPTVSSYVGTVDTIFVIENDIFPSAATMATRTFNGAYNKNNFAAIIHSQPQINSKQINDVMSPYVGYLYITDDIMANPYDTLPSYLVREAQTLSKTGFNIGELLTRSVLKSRAPGFPESFIIGEALTKLKINGKALAESFTVGETLTRATIKARALAQSFTMTDAATKIKSIPRALAESFTLTDSLSKIRAKVQALAESFSITDAVAKFKPVVKNLAEVFTITDAVAILVTHYVKTWILSGKSSDFPSRLDGLVIDYITSKWTETDPLIGGVTPTLQNENINIGNFDYDKFRTYYIKVKEEPATMHNRLRDNLYGFETPIEFECWARRLSKGEAFDQLNNIINELLKICIEYQAEDIFGVQGILFDSITPLETTGNQSLDSAAKTLWKKTLRVRLSYYKVNLLRGT